MKMIQRSKDLIIGDIHGNFNALNVLVNKLKPDRVHSTGDFGWWPRWEGASFLKGSPKPHKWKQDSLRTNGIKIYLCPGNHEDWWDLIKRDDNEELSTNLIYKPRCSTFTLPDNRNILYIGGADSIDKEIRTLGRDWFPEEMISYRDLQNLPNIKIDIIISHASPKCFGDMIHEDAGKRGDPCRWALDVVWDKYKPKHWFNGHYHKFMTGKYENTLWYSLSHNGMTGWWYWLPD